MSHLAPLPFSTAGLHFKNPWSDEALNEQVSNFLAEKYSEYMNSIGRELILCRSHPEPSMEDVRLAMFNDAEATDFAGSFVAYGVIHLGTVGSRVKVSAMAAPVMDGYPSDSWVESMAAVLAFFLQNDVPCEDGTILDFEKWRFPLESEGDPFQNQWFMDPEIDMAKRAEIISVFESKGLTVVTDNNLYPIYIENQSA